MNPADFLPAAVFFALGVVILVALWRIVVVGSEARRRAQATRLASDVAHRADVCLSDLVGTLDELRRRRLDPEEAARALTLGLEKMRVLVAEGQACAARTPSKAVTGLTQELDRALRSLELVEHGREVLAALGGNPGEGETSVKRGYLSLLHARDAIRERGNEVRLESAPAATLRALDRR